MSSRLALVLYNFSRPFATIDGFLAGGIVDFTIVLDNVPYCFVKPQNQFFLGFGLGSAPDDPEEFGRFIEDFVNSLVDRYDRNASQHLGAIIIAPRIPSCGMLP